MIEFIHYLSSICQITKYMKRYKYTIHHLPIIHIGISRMRKFYRKTVFNLSFCTLFFHFHWVWLIFWCMEPMTMSILYSSIFNFQFLILLELIYFQNFQKETDYISVLLWDSTWDLLNHYHVLFWILMSQMKSFIIRKKAQTNQWWVLQNHNQLDSLHPKKIG